MPPFWVGFSKQRKKPCWRRSSNCIQNASFRFSPSGRHEKTALESNFKISVSCHHFGWAFPTSAESRVDEGRPIAFKPRFCDFPFGTKRKNTLGIEFYNFGFMPPFWVGFSKQRKKPCWRTSSNCIQNASFRFSPSGRHEKTALESNFKISVSCHHFGWAFPTSAESRVDEGRPIAFKPRFCDFPFGTKRKNTLGIEFNNFGFMPPFWVSFSKQPKKPGWRRSSTCFQNAFFRLSPLGRNEKTALESNFTISVSCHHFGWAFPTSAKSRVDEGRRIAFKPRFCDFPFGTKRKNTLGIEFYNFGFMPPFWVGFSKQRKKPGCRRSSTCFQNAFFRLFPSGQNEKTPLGSNFATTISWHHFGWAFPSSAKSRVEEGRPIAFKTRVIDFSHLGETKKHPWERIINLRFHTTILGGLFQAAQKSGLTKVVQLRSKRVLSTFPIETKRKNTLGIEFFNFCFMPSFWVGFSKQRKKPGWRRLANWVQNAFCRLSPSGRNGKTPLGSNFKITVSYHHFGWAFPSRAKRRVDEGRPIAFKTRFIDFPHRAKRTNTLGIEFYNFGFMSPLWVGFSKQRKNLGWRRSSNCVQNAFFRLSPSGETKKPPWDQIPQGGFHTSISGGLVQEPQKAGLKKVFQLRSKGAFSTFPIGAKRKNSVGMELYNFGFMAPFWLGFSKKRKKPGWRRSSNCV